MRTPANLSKEALKFAISADLQGFFLSNGSKVKNEKNRAYFRSLLNYEKIPIWAEGQYKGAALAATNGLISLTNSSLVNNFSDYVFSYPFMQSSNHNGDLRDIVIMANDNLNLGIVIEKHPKARLPNPLLFTPNKGQYQLLDICQDWIGKGTTTIDYERSIKRILDLLDSNHGKRWQEVFPNISEKYERLYYPILSTISKELYLQCNSFAATGNLIKHLFGPNDYFLITPQTKNKSIKIAAYELNGHLGFGDEYIDSLLPKDIISYGFKENSQGISNSIISITFDNGWIVNLLIKLTGELAHPEGIRFEADFKNSTPSNLIQKEYSWA